MRLTVFSEGYYNNTIIPSILSIFKGNGDQKVFFSVDIPSMASLGHLESITMNTSILSTDRDYWTF